MRKDYQLIVHSQLGPRHGTRSIAITNGRINGALSLLGVEDEDGRFILFRSVQAAMRRHSCIPVFTFSGEDGIGAIHLKGCSMQSGGRPIDYVHDMGDYCEKSNGKTLFL